MVTGSKIITAAADLKRRRLAALAAVAVLWAAAALAAAVLIAFAASATFGWAAAAALAGAFLAAISWAWGRFIGRPLWGHTRRAALLRAAEAADPALRRRLAAAYDLAVAPEGDETTALLAAAFVADLEGRVPRRLAAPLARRDKLWPLAAAAAAFGAWAICFLAAPGFLSERWGSLAAASPLEDRLILTVSPGDTRVGVGRPLPVSVRTRAGVRGPVQVIMERPGGDRAVTLRALRAGEFAGALTAGGDDFRYYVTCAGERSRAFKVEVMPPPALENVAITLMPPAYAGLPPIALPAGEGDIAALPGTRVRVEARAAAADVLELVAGAGSSRPLGREGDLWTGGFTVGGAGSWSVRASSPWGEAATPRYRIDLWADNPPTVDVAAPGRDLLLSDRAAAPDLRFTCADDYGLGAVRVVYYNEISGQQLITVWGEGAGRRVLAAEAPLVPEALEVFPGDTISYYVEVFDNDTVAGPKAGRSAVYRFRFPSGAEMFAKVEAEMSAAEEEISSLRDEVRDFQNKVAAARAGEKDALPERSELRALATEQERLQRELGEAAAKIAATLERADEYQLSPELAAKLLEVQKLMRETLSEQQKETLRKLEEALRTADPEKVRELMKQVRLDQEEMARRLDALAATLRDARREELLRDLAEEAEELAQCQGEIKDALADGRRDAELAREQRKLAAEVPPLAAGAEKAAAEFAEADPALAAALKEAAAKARADAARAAAKAADGMEAGEWNAAAAAAERSSEELNETAADLRALADRFREGKRAELLAALDKTTERVLAASHRLEALADSARREGSASGTAGKARNLAAEVAAAAEGAREAAGKSFLVPPAVGEALAAAGEELNAAARNLELGNKTAAGRAEARALAGLNLAAAALLEARANAAAAGSSMGLAEMMERMGAMAEGQRGLNEAGRGMLSLSLSPSAAKAALEEMAAEQAMLKRAMEELASRAGGGERAGEFGGMARDMEEVAADLAAGRLDKRILEKQERLLDRMLTTSRSLREQGRTSRRRSEPAKVYGPPPVAPVPARLTTPRAAAVPAAGAAVGGYVPADLRAPLAEYYRRLAAEMESP